MNTNEHENNDQPVEPRTEARCPECAERRAAREERWGQREGRGDGRRGPWGKRPEGDGPRPPFDTDAGFGPRPHRHGHGCGPHGPHGHGRRFGRKIRRAYERGFAAGFAQGVATRETQATPAE